MRIDCVCGLDSQRFLEFVTRVFYVSSWVSSQTILVEVINEDLLCETLIIHKSEIEFIDCNAPTVSQVHSFEGRHPGRSRAGGAVRAQSGHRDTGERDL